LGEELDLRELQKSGRIGRIEVDAEVKSGKTSGVVTLPSSLDKAETSILAAALETVDRVGPCVARIEIESIQDTRSDKRKFVVERAKALLSKMGTSTPESKEISEKVRFEAKAADVKYYGKEREIIVVEGRADVLNLLGYGIKNVISLKGQKVPKVVAEFTKVKETTAFVDGDRGGDMIISQLSYEGKIDFVAKAPDGKEVEELTHKEILKCLNNKMTLERFKKEKSSMRSTSKKDYKSEKPADRRARPTDRRDRTSDRRSGTQDRRGGTSDRRDRPTDRRGRTTDRRDRTSDRRARPTDRRGRAPYGRSTERRPPRERKPVLSTKDEPLVNIYDGLKGSMRAAFVGKNGKVTKEVAVAEMIDEIKKSRTISAVVFDGIITKRLVELADKKGVQTLVGLKKAKIDTRSKVRTIAMEGL